MLHAVIRSGRDALHFFGEVSPYNLQTLRDHVRQSARESDPLHLRFEIARSDRSAFAHYTEGWLPKLRKSGATVEVAVVHEQ
ncbi:MAG TPA: hypothetical protein VL403_19570 [Candidatus Kryptonia bacterium]|nr:hypothetical protein [Candidatus Kryptonia bacterium]